MPISCMDHKLFSASFALQCGARASKVLVKGDVGDGDRSTVLYILKRVHASVVACRANDDVAVLTGHSCIMPPCWRKVLQKRELTIITELAASLSKSFQKKRR